MSSFCPKCGVEIQDEKSFCTKCGYNLAARRQQQAQVQVQPQQAQQPITSKPQMQTPKPQKQKKEKKQKQPKKHKLPGIVRFLLWLVGIAAVLLFLWFGFGNMVTLHLHSEDVVETLNAGSLDLPGMQSDYADLPQYVQDMLGEEVQQQQDGPIMQAILPHLKVERNKVNGFFGASSVEYTVTAPDIESWMLTLDPESVTTQEALQAALLEYIPYAPVRRTTVTVEYYRDGFFSVDWQGNYHTVAFADAISGGMNTAYNKLYEQALEELEEWMG